MLSFGKRNNLLQMVARDKFFAITLPLLICRGFAVTGRKSKNVQGRKNKLDALKSKLYTKLGIKIQMAAKTGGIDPTKNPDLARALKDAHQWKLPKDNIERALKRASDQSVEAFKQGTYEVFGHGGVGLLVTTLTDNTNRANMAVKAVARKAEAKMAASGSVLFKFDSKGCIIPSGPYSEDTVIEAAIEAGVDDVNFVAPTVEVDNDSSSTTNPILHILCDPTQLSQLQDALETKGIAGTSSIIFVPNSELVAVADEVAQQNWDLIEAFEDVDDVDTVYHDMEI